MQKWIFICLAIFLLAACNEAEQPAHTHAVDHYTNKQLSLQSSEGKNKLTYPPILQPTEQADKEVTYALTAEKGHMTFIDGIKTETYGYNGQYLGPVLRLQTGQQVTIKLTNALDEATTFHWHGLEVSGDATDGGPHAEIAPGDTKTIQFTVTQSNATLWYHPHPMGKTAEQVYKGLAGLIYIDDQHVVTNYPSDYAVNDFPIILQDRTFIDGQIDYKQVANTSSTLGDTIVINGVTEPFMTAPKEKIRLRILNGSNALTYYLHFDNNMPFDLIATDGGLLSEPQSMTSVAVGAGERVELVVDLSELSNVVLMTDETILLPIETTDRVTTSASNIAIATVPPLQSFEHMEPTKTVVMEGMTKNFLLNGQTYDMDRIDFTQQQGVTEIWQIENKINEEGAMAHPFHIHGTQFVVVSVNGEQPPAALTGYKDTITLQPNDVVQIAVTFPYAGIYMFHCHILEHEDAGMMGQIEVTPTN